MRVFSLFLLCILLCSCNSIYLKPGTLDTNAMIYTPRGGETIQRSIKQIMDERGYKTHVGRLTSVVERDSRDSEIYSKSKNIKYSVIVSEKTSILRPIWCMFNGFWWWRFELAISDRETGTEILSWRGRGCQNSSLRKLNDVLDQLEMNNSSQAKKPSSQKTSIKVMDSDLDEKIAAALEEEN